MPAPLLEARGLVKHLGGRRVVDGVDLVCRAGEVLGLLGPNGAGKTTTLRMLYGFLHPDAGEILVDGSPDLARMKREIGVCTQNDTFDGDFSVEQNLVIGATYFRPRPADVPGRVRSCIGRACCSSMSRPPASIRRHAWRCGTSWTGCAPTGSPSC